MDVPLSPIVLSQINSEFYPMYLQVNQLVAHPFPFFLNGKKEAAGIAAIGLFIVLFLFIYEPYGTHSFQSDYREVFLSGYGVIFALICLVFRFLLPKLNANFFCQERWNVGKQLSWFCTLFLANTIAWYFYWAWFFEIELSLLGWGRFIAVSFSIIVFPISAYLVCGYICQLRSSQLSNESLSHDKIALTDESGSETISLHKDQLLFVQSARNYVEIHYRKNDKVIEFLLRNSLIDIYRQLAGPGIVRCHRSYIANLNQATLIKRTSQGYSLYLNGLFEPVPVSRSKTKAILSYLKN